MLYKRYWVLLICFFTLPIPGFCEPVTVGAKKFTENYIVGEIVSQFLENEGITVNRKFGMGGTMVAYNALISGEIQVYPEYTGTIRQAIFHNKEVQLEKDGIEMLPALGFDNSYCLVMKRSKAQELGIKTISDLILFPRLTGAFSLEFQAREDGWNELKKLYSLQNKVRSIEIPLTYQAVNEGRVDFAEAYTTEPLLQKLDLQILEDDRSYFPKYEAVLLVQKKMDEKQKALLKKLSGQLSNEVILNLNKQVVEGRSIESAASRFLHERGLVTQGAIRADTRISWKRMLEQTKTHLLLTGLAVLIATLVSIPLATLILNKPLLAKAFLSIAGILQTIPSIALLTFMIPIFGIGFKAALFGLFIYSILPILRNSYTAMTGIDPNLITAARGIGLYPSEIFLSVKLPIAFPTILAGIRTATILNIGTATLAAFIGAGGLGEPIVTGLALNDYGMILQGAIPAALLALVIDGLFGIAERTFTKNF